MRFITLVAVSAIIAAPAFAQKSQSSGEVKIKGNTEIMAVQDKSTAAAIGEGNTAKNTAGAIKGGTEIKGNTKILAVQKNSTAAAIGKNNTAVNEAGVIGGK
jgi:hypothetical protein